MRRISRGVCLTCLAAAAFVVSLLAPTAEWARAADTAPPSARTADTAPPAAKAAATKPAAPTEEEGRQWAALFEKAVRKGDLSACDELIDWDALLDKATAYPNAPPELIKQRSDFIKGAKSTSRSTSGFTGQVLEGVRRGGNYKFLHSRLVDGHRRAEFRMITKDGGLNYHDFMLASDDGGLVRAVDCYVFLTGQTLSEAVRESFLPFARNWVKGGLGQLSPAERDFLANFSEFTAMVDSFHDKEHRQVLETYKRLPDSLKKMKTVLAIRLGSAQSISNEEYLQAIDDYRKFYPKDASIDLIALDAFAMRKAYNQALLGVDRVDKAVGGDAYLNVLRANLLLSQGKSDEAWKTTEAAIAAEPTLKVAYFSLLGQSLKDRKFAKTAELLSMLEAKFNMKFKDLTTVPAYAEFVKSDDYKKWIKSQHAATEE
jgi:hypothetical protein